MFHVYSRPALTGNGSGGWADHFGYPIQTREEAEAAVARQKARDDAEDRGLFLYMVRDDNTEEG